MTTSIPPKLYKYQSLVTGSHTLENLRPGKMWFSQPYLLNDPFDCSIPFTLDETDGEYQELFEKLKIVCCQSQNSTRFENLNPDF